ncbi:MULTISPECIES: LacI family DNA-binding transcriptional regulator [unclassified Rhizobium]|jgi:LacI family transcriptional regulator|uniref:LacI family DNA-binding transcriptional regulator n=1 Tax=unclassified Rhizobium TaxID=2613769 RepID=UPI0006461B90|nr:MULTISPECIES: LacI family DNA-binding transcriptional regulator [unclassified Rhizobium]OJY74466.1 MAG: LacI family transcriptional regulator [Rhizobium sp. 60-20]RKD67934.1 LacI family transcriptional regulator [Rhizobium sp. WW_1]
MAKPAARLKDIADKTGFSVNTVSLALRGSSRIPPETRALIADVARELNYLPNYVATSLVRRETRSIGLILTDLSNPVLTAVAQAVEGELSKRGYTTLFATSNNDIAVEEKMIETFRARRADGMLVFPCSHRRLDHIRKLRARNYPVVLLVGDPDAGIDAVCMDERMGAYKAVSHLLSGGHRRVAIIDGGTKLGNSEKLEGYMQAYRDAGADIDTALFIKPSGHSVAHGYWAADTIFSQRLGASAIFATNDSLALGVLRYCARNRIRVPDDVALMGFDNIEFGEYAVTPISTVDYNVERVSAMAVERVVDLISAEADLPPPRVTLIEPDLLIRQSSNSTLRT